IAFAPAQGNIWLFGRRYLLMQSGAFGEIRRELIREAGLEKARGIYTATGWHAGARLARQVAQQWPTGDTGCLVSAGRRLRMRHDVANAGTICCAMDREVGSCYSAMYGDNSPEAQVQLAHQPPGGDGGCWMQTGFGSGYASAPLG